jgi:NNP family nitrate/nitrite transporter-like MFS transporter
MGVRLHDIGIPMVTAMVLLRIFAKEPPDREKKALKDYLKVLVDRDAWVFNLLYSVTFGGFIGLASFLPTLFHDHYHIPKQSVGIYVTLGVVAASGLRVVGGWLADRVGGLRVLYGLFAVILIAILGASMMPSSAWAMAGAVAVAMGAMGAGNGAVFQLVPLRFRVETAGAGSLIGEIGERSRVGSFRTPWGSASSTTTRLRRGSSPERSWLLSPLPLSPCSHGSGRGRG